VPFDTRQFYFWLATLVILCCLKIDDSLSPSPYLLRTKFGCSSSIGFKVIKGGQDKWDTLYIDYIIQGEFFKSDTPK
jgi:hypothetical protein